MWVLGWVLFWCSSDSGLASSSVAAFQCQHHVPQHRFQVPTLSPPLNRNVKQRIYLSVTPKGRFSRRYSESQNNDWRRRTSSSSSSISMTLEDSQEESSKLDKEDAKRVYLEAERAKALSTRAQIDKLETQLKALVEAEEKGSTEEESQRKRAEKRREIRQQVELLAKAVASTSSSFKGRPATVVTSTSSGSVGVSGGGSTESNKTSQKPTVPLSDADLALAVDFYEKLPISIQLILAEAIELSDTEPGRIGTLISTKEIVQKLYEQSEALLADSSQWANRRSNLLRRNPTSLDALSNVDGAEVFDIVDLSKFASEVAEEGQMERFVESFYPSVTRKEGKAPTRDEADLFFTEVLGSKTFSPTSKPERIPGGFLIRGVNKMKDGQTMVEAIDKEMLEKQPSLADKVQFFYVKDPTPAGMEDFEDLWGPSVMILLGKDMSPERNVVLQSIVTLLTLGLTLYFGVSTFGETQAVLDRVKEANAAGDFDSTWFNLLVLPLLGSTLATQLSHEMAHLVVAWKDKFKTGVPTLLPAPYLPFFGASTPIKTPPKDLKSLFDFGLAGPIVGIIVSLAFLFFGLQTTLSMNYNSEAFSYLPRLSVDYLRCSSLGGGIVDAMLGGGLLQQPLPEAGGMMGNPGDVTIPLHPYAIGGFVGLIINALNLLPIGNTDGGRVSISLFGRNGHILAQGLTYLVLFGAGLFGADRSNILLTYGVFTFFTQRELEIPCRNEIDDVDFFPRAFVAIVAWLVVALTLIPISS